MHPPASLPESSSVKHGRSAAETGWWPTNKTGAHVALRWLTAVTDPMPTSETVSALCGGSPRIARLPIWSSVSGGAVGDSRIGRPNGCSCLLLSNPRDLLVGGGAHA
jgi:hypothetical protein